LILKSNQAVQALALFGKMEDGLNFNGGRPQYVVKRNTTSICLQLEDNIYYWQMEDEHSFLQGKVNLSLAQLIPSLFY
jgi:hypothetical protein